MSSFQPWSPEPAHNRAVSVQGLPEPWVGTSVGPDLTNSLYDPEWGIMSHTFQTRQVLLPPILPTHAPGALWLFGHALPSFPGVWVPRATETLHSEWISHHMVEKTEVWEPGHFSIFWPQKIVTALRTLLWTECVFQNSYTEALIPNVITLHGGALRET